MSNKISLKNLPAGRLDVRVVNQIPDDHFHGLTIALSDLEITANCEVSLDALRSVIGHHITNELSKFFA